MPSEKPDFAWQEEYETPVEEPSKETDDVIDRHLLPNGDTVSEVDLESGDITPLELVKAELEEEEGENDELPSKSVDVNFEPEVVLKEGTQTKKESWNEDSNAGAPNTKRFRCNLCKSAFSRRCSLHRHSKYHCSMRPETHRKVDCNLCFKTFSAASSLNRHVKLHARATKDLMCPICNKQFLSIKNLIKHQAMHYDRFECVTCGKAFKYKSSLVDHMVIHNDEKTYDCTVCEQSFPTPRVLRGHMITHAEERKYHCLKCGKSFLRRYHLKLHDYLHTGRRDYHCPVCLKGFVKRYHLERHCNTHGHTINTDENSRIDTLIHEDRALLHPLAS